jgi:ribosomal protein S18 acetylase RimI-like enzyme
VTVRQATSTDVGGILALWESARSPLASQPDEPEGLSRAIATGAVLVAESGDRLVGVVIAGWDGWRGNMYRLTVRADVRRRGVARHLVEAGHRRLRALGARRVSALVGVDEEVASAFWQALGYEPDPKMLRFVRGL